MLRVLQLTFYNFSMLAIQPDMIGSSLGEFNMLVASIRQLCRLCEVEVIPICSACFDMFLYTV